MDIPIKREGGYLMFPLKFPIYPYKVQIDKTNKEEPSPISGIAAYTRYAIAEFQPIPGKIKIPPQSINIEDK